MMINKVFSKLSIYKWNCICLFKKTFDKKFRQRLLKNKSLYNIHKGERCFIVGNAPSLKKMDLSHITYEYVLTVNDIHRNSELFYTLQSIFHVFIDPSYGEMSSESKSNYINKIKEINPNIKLFTSYKYIDLPGYRNENNLYSLFQHKDWSTRNAIDIASNLLVAQNVVQTAIYLAMYMGFKNIYLIGCDMTSLYENLEYNASGNLVSQHAYEGTEEDKSIYEKIKDRCDNTYMLEEYGKVFRIFKNIEKMSRDYNCRIYNATVGGILDMFERVDYISIL